jgi:hypothetical protein
MSSTRCFRSISFSARSLVGYRTRLLVLFIATACIVVCNGAPALAATTPETPEGEEANPVGSTTATLKGVLNPNSKGEPGSTYEFLYKQSATECEGGEATSGIELEKTPEPVQAEVTGLLRGTRYTFCLRATNTEGEAATGSAVTFTTLALPPVVSAESASGVEASVATLQARVDPAGAETTYHFEYDTTPYTSGMPHGTSTPGVRVGDGAGAEPASARVRGLTPDTMYHYRVVASNSLGTVDGPDQTLTTLAPPEPPSAGCPNEALRAELGSMLLPECRAYELVTPPYKEGYKVSVVSYSTNGGQAIVNTLGDLADEPGESEALLESSLLLDTRTSTGWQVTPLNPPSSEFVGQIPVAQEANSGDSLWVQHTPAQSGLVRDLYLRSGSGASTHFTLIGPINPPLAGEEEPSNYMEDEDTYYDTPTAGTSDYSHVVLVANSTIDFWPFDPTTGAPSLYEYAGTGNKEPILVGVREEEGKTELISRCGTELGSGDPGSMYNALAGEGEIIFFTPIPCGSEPPLAEVYARLHGSHVSSKAAETIDVSESECTRECGAEESGKNFEGASESGERVFFTSTQKLTDDAVDGTAAGNAAKGEGCAATSAGEGGCNLYEYNFSKPEHERLRAVSEGGEVLGVAAIAEDGARVYYVADDVVASAQPNPYGRTPQADEPNLYVYDTQTGTTAFVATLSGADSRDWQREARRSVELAGEGGAFALFASVQSGLTPDDQNERGQVQLFEYAAANGSEPAELVRVTKGENGFNDDGNGVNVGVAPESVARMPGYTTDWKTTTNRLNISSDGRTIVFETVGQLSPRATASASGCSSVYEFHTAGALSQGAVHLLSDGSDVALNRPRCGAHFEGMDGDGANVLFETADSLVPSDVDGGQRDVYDARINGGFEPAVGVLCTPAACAGPTQAAPSLSALAGSSLVQSPEAGVLPPLPVPVLPKAKPKKASKCPKGKRRNSKGRCVRTVSRKRVRGKRASTAGRRNK